MKKTLWSFAIGIFKVGLLMLFSWFLWGVLTYVTVNLLQRQLFTTPDHYSPVYGYIFVLIEAAEFVGSVVFVTWAMTRLDRQPEKQKRKEKPKALLALDDA